MTKLHQCKYRFGLTGTLDDTQTHRLVLEGLFGRSKNVITTKELIDKKTLANLKIKCIVLVYPDADREIIKEFGYAEELEYIVTKPERNNFVVELIAHLSGNTLCLFQFVEKHGEVLYKLMNEEYNDRPVFFVYGGVDTNTREEIREIVENEKNSVIIASYGTFSTGINIKRLHNVIFASPSKSRVRNLQSIGRVLRKGKGKVKAMLYDIADDCTHQSRKNYTLNHLIERIKTYNEEQFNYEIVSIR